MRKLHNKDGYKLKGARKGRNMQQAIWLCGLQYSKKECIYHVIEYSHDSVVLNKNIGKFYKFNIEESYT